MPTIYKIILSLLVIVGGLIVIVLENPDLSRVAFLYDYYLLPNSLLFFKESDTIFLYLSSNI